MKINILSACFLFAGFLLFCDMPKSLTSIHKIGSDFKKFSKDNPQYEKKGDLLIRKKPKRSGSSWNYDLIALEKDDKNLITSALFKVYNNSSKKHIKDKKQLRKLLSNQFRENKYSIIKKKDINEILRANLLGKALDYAIKNFKVELVKTQIVCSDYKNFMIFFSYNDSYYIFISKFKKYSTADVVEEKKIEEAKKDATDDALEIKDEKIEEVKKDTTDDALEIKDEKIEEVKKDTTDDAVKTKDQSPVEDKKNPPIEENKEISKDATDDAVLKNENSDLTSD